MKQKTALASSPVRFYCYFLSLFFLLISFSLSAQTVTGTVLDEDSKPVVGASVTVKGTNKGTITNSSGNFSINALGTDVLVISYVGFVSQVHPLNGKTSLSVKMFRGDGTNMDEVVVVGLGIKKEAKKLGYAAETVKMNEIQQNRTNNVMASLEGKIAGLDISPPSAGAAASTKIRLRGQSSFAGANNAPLFVINGLPMNQGANGANGSINTRDQGDNLLLFNPDDVESITVLKGAAAAAIYGSRAANGAIIITTKNGSKNAGIGVELTSSYSSDEVLDYTDYQYEYGQGQGKVPAGSPPGTIPVGARPLNQGEAQGTGQLGWGERYDGVLTPQFDGVSRPYSPHHDRLKEFFNTGATFNNTVAVSGGNSKASFRASFSNMQSKGITPGNDYYRRIFNVGANQSLGDKVTVQVNVNYTSEKNKNPPQVGVQGQNYMNFIVRTSPVVPLEAYKEHTTTALGGELPSNGLYFDKNGFLIACADMHGELWKIAPDGSHTVLVNNYNNKLLNGPNDVWINPVTGGMYITDPMFPRGYWDATDPRKTGNPGWPPVHSEQGAGIAGHVYYLAPGSHTLVRVTTMAGWSPENSFPNGVVGSPDGKKLYVNKWAGDNMGGTWVFDINPNGTLSNMRKFVDMGGDGMSMDERGNVYISNGLGVTAFDKFGNKVFNVPMNGATNNVFAGANEKTLFITGPVDRVTSLKMNVKGVEKFDGNWPH